MAIRETKINDYPHNEGLLITKVFDSYVYENRINALSLIASEQGYTDLIIYGDREHFSNIYYLTGFDPRFEEALLIIPLGKKPILIIGNECYSYADIMSLQTEKVLFPSFSLMGQPRDQAKDISKIFEQYFNTSSRVGIVGWKYFEKWEVSNPEKQIDIPYYIVSSLINIIGEKNIKNATDLMLHPEYGVRTTLDFNDILSYEAAGTKSSQAMLRVLKNLKEGQSEIESSKNFCIDGDPIVAHPNVNFGDKNTLYGLASPSENRLAKGSIVNFGFGYRYSMVARTGIFVSNKNEIPSKYEGIVEKLYIPYFELLCAWYESLSVGEGGGNVFKEVKKAAGDMEKMGISLNPGHLIHSDEWTTSIFYENSTYKIKSGMAIQCDIIAFPGKPYIGVHVEDGLIIADEQLQKEIQEKAPEAWQRIDTRRRMMKEIIGLNISDDLLPVSDIQCVLNPYMADLQILLSKR